MTDPRGLYDLARATATEAAVFVRENRPPGRVAVAATKSSPRDLVTELDRASERLIRERVHALRPDDAFLGEEHAGSDGTSEVRWVVDPIDGTVNFVHGIPACAVSIGVEVQGRPAAGVVVNIVTGEEWGAVAGEGSWRSAAHGWERLRPADPVPLSQALVGTGFAYVDDVRRRQVAALARLLPEIGDIRRSGSAALDLCAVADGRIDAFVEEGLQPWDRAAGGLIAAEAGCILAGFDGPPDQRLTMAAQPGIATEYFALVRACGF